MKRQEHYVSDSYNDYLNKAIQNIYIPVNYTPILPEPRNGVISTLQNSFNKIEELNERIKSTNDDVLKSTLKQQKNAICKRMIEYSGDSINKSQVHQDQEEYRAYKMKFWNEQEQDMDLMEKHYGEFKPANYSNNKMLLEIKSYYENLEDTINKTLIDKNIDQEFIDKTWQSVRQNYKNHVEKCESHEKFVKQMQYKVLDHGCLFGGTDKPKSFIDAKNMAEQLNVKHKQAIDNLKFNSEQVIKQFVSKGFEISGQLPEDSSIILEIKGTYESLEEKINKSLADKNIDEEVKNQVWELPYYSSKYKQVLDKLKTHEQWVRVYEDKILNCETLSEANSFYMELKKIHKDTTEELNFHTNQAIKHFVTKALQISGQLLEESPMMLDIKGTLNEFKEKINKNFEDNVINEKIKLVVEELFRSKCNQHLDKLKLVEKAVQKCEHELLMCDNFQQSKIIIDSLSNKQSEIDSWKFESADLIEEIINKATEFSYQTAQVQHVLNEPQLIQPVVNMVPNQHSNLIIEESEMDSVIEDSLSIITTHSVILNQTSLINPIIANEGSVAILKIKSLLDGFEKKLNDSLNDNSDIINEKIKSAIYKIYHPKCKKHLEKLELIEKSIKKYEVLPNSQKTEKIINHLKQRYKQIDKWEVDSDDLIETITMKALELSCKTEPMLNEQNNLQVQKLSDQVTELTKIIDKISQNPMGIPPINELDHDESDSFQILNLNQSIKSLSLFEHVEAVSENDGNKEKKIKKDKWRAVVKGEFKLIKMGIKKYCEDDEIQEDLKYTKNHLLEIKEYFKNHNDDFITKGNESYLIEVLGEYISDVSE